MAAPHLRSGIFTHANAPSCWRWSITNRSTFTQIVHEEDPKAFMFVHETYQVLGEGFVPMGRIVSSKTT